MTWIDLYVRTWRSKKRVTRSCYKYNRYDFSVSVTCFTIYSYCPKNWKNSQICISGLTSRFRLYLDLEWLQNIFLALPSEFSICIIVNSMWPLHKSVLCIRIGYSLKPIERSKIKRSSSRSSVTKLIVAIISLPISYDLKSQIKTSASKLNQIIWCFIWRGQKFRFSISKIIQKDSNIWLNMNASKR